MKLLVAQRNPIVGDIDGNTAKILESLDQARHKGVDLVMFGELMLCGYPPEDLVYHRTFIDSMELHLERIVRASSGLIVIVGLIRRNIQGGEKDLLNSAAVIHDGKLLGFQDKWLLPTYDVFEERRYFEPGTSPGIWEIGSKKIGLMICEDIWQHAGYVEYTRYERDPVEALMGHHLEVLLNISASPYQFQKPDMRLNVCTKAARTLQCPVVMCCQVGANGQIVFDGYSVYVNQKGELCQLGKGFEEDAMVVDLEAEGSAITFEYEPMSNLLSALTLGVKDYFSKLGLKKACLGLSGGVDSALVAYITARALGPDQVLGISMPAHDTTKESQRDSLILAKNLGIDFLEIVIKKPFKAFLNLLTPYFEGKEGEVTQENLQARIRGMILMAFSNQHGYIVLSTGNKSEIALGYNTLYGDMCGALGVIGDVTKSRVYDLCHYINALEKKEVIPSSVFARSSSAELRSGQMDLDVLPDYTMVDSVLEGYIENYLSIDEISEKYDIPQEVVLNLIEKIHAAEYKRRQGLPILRVSKKSFGVGRRYPIVQQWL